MYKELQLHMGSPTVKIVARERRQESIWSNTMMSEQISGQISICRVGRGKEQVPGGREKHAGAWCALRTRTVKFKGGREVGRGGWRRAGTAIEAGAREAG